MHVRRVSTAEDFEQLRPVWNQLAGDVPFQRWEWLRPWWAEFSKDRQLFVLEARDDSGTVRGIAPWFAESSLVEGRVLRFLGSGRVCSEYLNLLAAPEDQAKVAETIASWLNAANEGGDPWNALQLDSVSECEGTPHDLVSRLQQSGHRIYQVSKCHCWRIPLAETWSEFLASRPKRYRRKMRNISERMLDSGTARCEIATTPDECQATVKLLTELHLARRQSQGESSYFSSCQFRAFFNKMAKEFQAAGRLYLVKLTIEGELAGCSLGLLGSRTNYIYQCGISPDHLKWQPGWIMNVFTLRHAIKQGLRSVDFLRGDEHYKTHLGAKPVHSATLEIVPNRVSSVVRNQLSRSVRYARSVAKTVLKKQAVDEACCRECR